MSFHKKARTFHIKVREVSQTSEILSKDLLIR